MDFLDPHTAPGAERAAATADATRAITLPVSAEDLRVILCILRQGPASRVEFDEERKMAQAVEDALAAGLEIVPIPGAQDRRAP